MKSVNSAKDQPAGGEDVITAYFPIQGVQSNPKKYVI